VAQLHGEAVADCGRARAVMHLILEELGIVVPKMSARCLKTMRIGWALYVMREKNNHQVR